MVQRPAKMMPPFPWIVHFGPLDVSAHVVFESAAYAVGFAVYRHQRGQRGDVIGDRERTSVIAAAILGAALGSKLLFLLEDPDLTLQHWRNLAYIMGGKTIVGGLLGGTLAVEWIKTRLGIISRTGDLFALPLILGTAIGRIGCFVSGLEDRTYGIATSLPWGIDLGDGISRHPVQLYEIVFLAGLALALRTWRAQLPSGGQFRAFLMLYCSWRFAIDFLKPGSPVIGLTPIQWVCLAAVLFYMRNVLSWFGWRRQEAHG